jgi:hypothetical protein
MRELNAIDWTNLDNWEGLPETLERIGLSIPEDELQNFIKIAQESAGAIRNIDLDKLNEELQKLLDLKNKIATKEQGRTFSDADYKSLISTDASLANQFAQTLSGDYIYLGSSMETLIKAINKNTETRLEEAKLQLESKI